MQTVIWLTASWVGVFPILSFANPVHFQFAASVVDINVSWTNPDNQEVTKVYDDYVGFLDEAEDLAQALAIYQNLYAPQKLEAHIRMSDSPDGVWKLYISVSYDSELQKSFFFN